MLFGRVDRAVCLSSTVGASRRVGTEKGECQGGRGVVGRSERSLKPFKRHFGSGNFQGGTEKRFTAKRKIDRIITVSLGKQRLPRLILQAASKEI